MGILCVFCVYDTIGNRCFEKTSFPKTTLKYFGNLAKSFLTLLNFALCIFHIHAVRPHADQRITRHFGVNYNHFVNPSVVS